MGIVSLTIDNREVQVEEGKTVLEAARKAGIRIPTLCYHPHLTPYGGCRLCVVHVEGMWGLRISCMTKAAEGMQVTTENAEILSARRMVLRLLLADHPGDCVSCRQNLRCELQALAVELGVLDHGLIPIQRVATYDDSNPVFLRDMSRCVLCVRCVRACDEIVGLGAIDLLERGKKSEPSPRVGGDIRSSTCESCGECVVHCPTGALAFAEPEPKVEREVQSICPYCGVGCSITLGVRNGKVVRARGTPTCPVSHGVLCVKGRFGSYEYVNHPERLSTPLVRRDGELKEASWDEALSLVSEKLKATPKGAFGAFCSAKVPNEDNYVLQKFTRAVMGTNNIDHCARLCHSSTVAGLAAAFGSGAMTNSIADIEQAKVFLVTGSNTTETHPIIGWGVRRAVNKGAKLILFDPRRINLADCATIWCRQRPGTDVAWINGLIHVILEEGLEDRAYIEERTEGVEALREVVKQYDPQTVSKITGVDAEDIVDAARLYASGAPATILYAMGITQHTTGTDNVKSLANLAMLCGNVGKAGGGVNPLRGQNNVQGACDMGGLPNVYPGYQKVIDPGSREKFEQAWGAPLSDEMGQALTEMLPAALRGEIKSLYIMGENPMLSDADIGHVKQALEAVDFLVVQDIFLTETARLADVVLPATSYAEREGTVTNTERRVQLSREVIPPLPGARRDWEIVCDVATRMGYAMHYESAAEIMDEIASVTPSYGGISYARLDHGEELCWPCPTPEHPGTPILHQHGFARGKGLFHAIEYLPANELPDKRYPMVLTTGRILEHFHTGTMTRKSKGLDALVSGPFVEMSHVDARKLRIKDGQKVRVASRRGAIELAARVQERVEPGVVFVPFHFWEAAANALTNPAYDPIAKIPEFKVCAVRVERA
jgi:formate dehydrogenase alpha subunit